LIIDRTASSADDAPTEGIASDAEGACCPESVIALSAIV
jgi:hypothetical protein